MPIYRVRSNGVSYLYEASSRDAALVSVITEIVAGQLRLLLPADLAVDDWDETQPFMNKEPNRPDNDDLAPRPIPFNCQY